MKSLLGGRWLRAEHRAIVPGDPAVRCGCHLLRVPLERREGMEGANPTQFPGMNRVSRTSRRPASSLGRFLIGFRNSWVRRLLDRLVKVDCELALCRWRVGASGPNGARDSQVFSRLLCMCTTRVATLLHSIGLLPECGSTIDKRALIVAGLATGYSSSETTDTFLLVSTIGIGRSIPGARFWCV